MIKELQSLFQKAKQDFLSMDLETGKLVKSGLQFSFAFMLFSVCLLLTYLLVHNPDLFFIGYSLFKSSIFFNLAFIAFGIIFYNIKKQTN